MSRCFFERLALAMFVTAAAVACEKGPSTVVALSSVTPAVGPAGAATEITIKGRGFRAGAIVTLGAPATNVSVLDDSTIVARTPDIVEGIVHLHVRNQDGGSATLPGAFEFVGAMPPKVFSISPKDGRAGWSLVVTGLAFKSGAMVTFGGVPATSTTFVSDKRLTIAVPMLPGGAVDVIVTNPNGEFVTVPSAFTFHIVTMSAGASSVSAGGGLSVTWNASVWASFNLFEFDDWIGLFPSGAPTQASAAVWWEWLPGQNGTLTLSAPVLPGSYEFRYVSGNTAQAVVSVVVTGSAP